MTSTNSERVEKASGPSRRLLTLLVGLLVTVALIVSGAGPATAQNAVGPQPQNSILTIGQQTIAAPEGVGVQALPLRPIVSATGVAADSEASAAAKALSRLPKSARVSEKPPAFDAQTWQWRSVSRNTVGKDWWDPEGGEWRYHPADKYHDPHFDYNPWTQWNSPWQHLYPGR